MRIRSIIDDPNSVFHQLSLEEKEELEKHISLTRYRKNRIIFKEGDKPIGFVFLVSGKVKLYKKGISGRNQIVRLAQPLDIIGFRAFFAEQNHMATAVTLEDALICTVSFDFILTTALKNNHFSLQVIQKLSRQLGHVDSRIVALTQKHTRGRLADSLLLLKNEFGFADDGVTLDVNMSRVDIANLSNMTTSNAIRTLSSFASEKVIAIDGRKIKILDLPRLERVSRLG